MLYDDLLLTATSVLVQSLSQYGHRPGGFIGQLQIFGMGIEIMIRRTRPRAFVQSLYSSRHLYSGEPAAADLG